MIVRRFAATALAALMLHLNVVQADAACAVHDAHDVKASHDHGGAVATHDAQHAPTSAGETACDTPSQPECCDALASCSTVFGDGDGVAAEDVARPHAGAMSYVTTALLSRVATPDPPPPRA